MPSAGVPASVAVPSPLSVKVTPLGSEPDSDSEAAGVPVLVTVKVPAVPTLNVVWSALVIDGASLTVSVKSWVAFGLVPLLAVMVMG